MKHVEEENEDTVMWREVKEHKKLERAERRTSRSSEIDALRERGFEVTVITPYHYRINKALDIYPTNGKWHNLATGERGRWTNLSELIANQLTEPAK